MRTKTLLLTAALSAAGLASTLAQVYSVNAVGYVNQTAPANKLAILAIPLNGTNNELNTTMPLPPGLGSEGVTIYRFDVATQNYYDGITWFDGFGWFYPGTVPNATVVNPGEGLWVQNPNGADVPITYVGEVPSGTLVNQVPGQNRLKLAASMKPVAAPLGDPATPGSLLFPGAEGDTVYIFNVATQNYKDGYTYFVGFGWFSANVDDPGPAGPTIPVATGFWTQLPGDYPQKPWTQTFSVN